MNAQSTEYLFRNNRICTLMGIRLPIIQAGMVWCSGHKLASACSNAGALGILGAGSMYPDVLREHIRKVKSATTSPFGVNVPLMYPDIDAIMSIIRDEHVPIVITSAGSPKTWTKTLQADGIKVLHVVSSTLFALKSQDAGVDAVIAEGFEAGGHNGREETTTLCLIPAVAQAVDLPVVAAGGIGSGSAMAAAFCLGADGVQVGTALALSEESSAHHDFKQHCLSLGEGDTKLLLKKLSPTRLAQNDFMQKVQEMEAAGATKEELQALLGKRRSKRGIFEGDLIEGELEIGQVSAQIKQIHSAADILYQIISDYHTAADRLPRQA